MPEAATGSPLLGLALALLTALLWAVSYMCWSIAGQRIGVLNVCLVRSTAAGTALLCLLPFYICWRPGVVLPDAIQLFWLVLSSASGLVLGDLLAFRGLILMGPRRGGQFVLVTPIAAVLASWLWLGEALPALAVFGVAVVIAALGWVVRAERPAGDDRGREPGRFTARGITLAVGGAMMVGLGTVFARRVFAVGPSPDVFVATALRVAISAPLLWAVLALRGTRGPGGRTLAESAAPLAVGVIAGPILGMVSYMMALSLAPAGLVGTLSSLSPVFLIAFAAMRYRICPEPAAVLGILAAVAGVALVFAS